MKKVVICILVLFLGALSSLEAQDYCGKLLHSARYNSNKGNYSEAILLLNELDICDAADSFLLDRQSLLKEIFQAINQQKKSLKITADSLIKLNVKVKKALDSLQKSIVKLKNSTIDQVRSLLDVAKNMQNANPYYALEKVKAVEPLIKLVENSRELNEIKDTIENQQAKAYLDLGESIKANIREQLTQKRYNNVISLLLILKEIKQFPVDSANQLWALTQTQLLGSIEKKLEHSDYDLAFEQCHLLSNFKNFQENRSCIYFELAFCFTITQQFEKSNIILDTLIRTLQTEGISSLVAQYKIATPSQKLPVLKQILQQFSPKCAQNIQNRYFPNHFISVGSGITLIDSCMIKVNSFVLAEKELSFFEFDLFCLATKRPKPDDNGWGRGDRPAIDLSWYDAIAYCYWRSELDSLEPAYAIKGDTISMSPLKIQDINITFYPERNGYRLPFESEWQLAAGNFNYGWGNDVPLKEPFGNLHDTLVKVAYPFFNSPTNYHDGYLGTAPVGAFPANPLGFFNLSGNVWEWCWETYSVNFCKRKAHFIGQREEEAKEKILKGGAWSTNLVDALVKTRMHEQPNKQNFSIGFRMAKKP